jgi:small-conductance mechanosensitive channel
MVNMQLDDKNSKNGIGFRKKNVTVQGIMALVLVALSMILFIISAFYSAHFKGNADAMAGVLGILCICLSALAVTMAADVLKKNESRQIVPVITIILAGLQIIFLFGLFLAGMAI